MDFLQAVALPIATMGIGILLGRYLVPASKSYKMSVQGIVDEFTDVMCTSSGKSVYMMGFAHAREGKISFLKQFQKESGPMPEIIQKTLGLTEDEIKELRG